LVVFRAGGQKEGRGAWKRRGMGRKDVNKERGVNKWNANILTF
jgi:hypothetical protein